MTHTGAHIFANDVAPLDNVVFTDSVGDSDVLTVTRIEKLNGVITLSGIALNIRARHSIRYEVAAPVWVVWERCFDDAEKVIA